MEKMINNTGSPAEYNRRRTKPIHQDENPPSKNPTYSKFHLKNSSSTHKPGLIEDKFEVSWSSLKGLFECQRQLPCSYACERELVAFACYAGWESLVSTQRLPHWWLETVQDSQKYV